MANWINPIAIAALAASLPAAWAQHGHGAAPMGGHGAPIEFHNPATTTTTPATATTAARAASTGARTTTTGSAAAANSPAHTSVATRVANNPALSAHVTPLLPAGTTLAADAAGFRNTGQFLAALHVSRNLNIPFSQLKSDITGANHDSLGQAIQDLRPNLSQSTIKNNVKLARSQARQDVRSSTSGNTGNIATHISQNSRLMTRVNALLPAGTTLQADTVGFRNQGQFIAALHVSRNLNIPFTQLQAEIAGGKTLGQAIADLRPSLSSTMVEADLSRAERQTRRDFEVTESMGS